MVSTAVAASIAGVLLVGTGSVRSFISTVWPTLNRDNGWVYNQTWNGVISRLGDHAVFASAAPSTVVRLGALALGAGGLLWAAWAVRPGARPAEVRGAEFGAGVVAMLLSGSLAWIAHDVHLLIPIFAALGLVAVHGRRTLPAVRVALSSSVLGIAVLVPLLIAGTSMASLVAASHSHGWWLQLQLWSIPALAGAGLLVALGRVGVKGTGGRAAAA